MNASFSLLKVFLFAEREREELCTVIRTVFIYRDQLSLYFLFSSSEWICDREEKDAVLESNAKVF